MHAVLVVVEAEAAEVIPAGVAALNVVVHAVGKPLEPSDACAVEVPWVPQYPAAMPAQNVFALWSFGTEAAVVPAGHENHLPLFAVLTNQFPLLGLEATLQASTAVLPATAVLLDGHAVQPLVTMASAASLASFGVP